MNVARSKPKPNPKSETSKHRLRLWLRLLRTTRFIEMHVREKLRLEYQSTLPRFDVLSALDRNRGGLLMSELSQQLKVSNGNVTGIVDRLVEDGLVLRLAVAGDRRATRAVLSKAGIAVFADMAVQHERWVDQLLSDIDVDEAQHMIDTLSAIRKEA